MSDTFKNLTLFKRTGPPTISGAHVTPGRSGGLGSGGMAGIRYPFFQLLPEAERLEILEREFYLYATFDCPRCNADPGVMAKQPGRSNPQAGILINHSQTRASVCCLSTGCEWEMDLDIEELKPIR